MRLSNLEETKEKFNPHMMYDPKTGEGKYAKVEKDHLDMKEKGWGHDKPKVKEGSYNNAPEPRKMEVTVADKKANTEAWKRYRAGDPRYEFKNPTTEAEVPVNEHEIGLLGKVARQMEADAHSGDYTAIEELLHNVTEEEMEAFLSDHRNDWDESVEEGKYKSHAQRKAVHASKAEKLKELATTNTISSRQTYNAQSKGGVEKDNFTSHARDYDSKKGLTTHTTAQQFDGSTSDRFIMPGGSGIQTTTGADGAYKEKKIQMKGPQSWAYDKPKLNASKQPKVREAGSPWTATGKHPEKMTVDELWSEIAVFDHIQDRGERLTPKDMMRLDSLFSYMDTAEMNEQIKRKADSMMESSKWKAKRNK